MPEEVEKVLIHAGFGKARQWLRITFLTTPVKHERRRNSTLRRIGNMLANDSADLIEALKGGLANVNK
jgi:hypothetical protein